MRFFTNLLFKVSVSSMILTAPAMIDGHAGGGLTDRGVESPFATATVIRNYIDHLKIWPVRAYVDRKSMISSFPYIAKKPVTAAVLPLPEPILAAPVEKKELVVRAVVVHSTMVDAAVVRSTKTMMAVAFRAAELKRVINQSERLYSAMGLEKEGLSETAFEYAWRGYHNLLKKGAIHRKSVLSIADFSQSSTEKRMYVIDIRHKRLLYRTYVAHGQNSGSEFAEDFSNEPESFKSSLGFYVTKTTYYGRNGLSLRLDGVDEGYNDKALKRNIVLHGCAYVGDEYLENFGSTGTSLGCPALPAAVSGQIIQKVKNGTCLFIYHPTQEYLDHSVVINE
jgi:hypothetical protein